MKTRFVLLCLLIPLVAQANPTFTKDIAPIIYDNCLICHRKGDVAPFALETYDQNRRKARTIARVCEKGYMPPWKPVAGIGKFHGERRLSDAEIKLLRAWAEEGAPEGDPNDLPPLPKLPKAGSWRLGEPDVVLEMPEEFEVPADGPDIYRYFVLKMPPEMQQDQMIVGIDFKPGDASVVHHSDYFIDYAGKARQQKSTDGKPGFTVEGTGGFFEYSSEGGFLGAWAPGSDPFRLDDGIGMELPGGGDIVLEIHYKPSGKPAHDRSSIAFYFAKKPVTQTIGGIFMGTQDLDIPAGEKNYWRHVWMDIPVGIKILDLGPHMHYIGKEAHVTADLPDGTTQHLLSIKDWDLDWQTGYKYKSPVHLPAGSRLHMRTRFDNTDQNSDNPHVPAQRIQWGWGTEEEMCELYVTLLFDNPTPRNKATLANAEWASWIRSADPEATKISAGKPDIDDLLSKLLSQSMWTAEGERLMNAVSGSKASTDLIERLRQRTQKSRKDVPALVALGNLLGQQTWYESNTSKMLKLANESDAAYDRAIRADAYNWDAWMGKAALYGYSEESAYEKQAIKILVETVDSQEKYKMEPYYARTYEVLADIYVLQKLPSKAKAALERGLKHFPSDTGLQEGLTGL